MAYVPNNQAIFIAAYAGALAGMGASGRVPNDTNSADYAGVASTAGFFAQAYDTVWGGRATTDLDIRSTEELCAGAWLERSVLALTQFQSPTVYLPLANSLVAMITAAETFFTSQGISPVIPVTPVVGVGDWSGPSTANHLDKFHGPGGGVPVAGFVGIRIDAGVIGFVFDQAIRTDAAGGQPMVFRSQSAEVGGGASSGDFHVALGYSDAAFSGARKIFFDADQTPGGGVVVNLGFFDNFGRCEIAGGTTSAGTAIGAALGATSQAGVHFALASPANTTATTHAIGGDQKSTHVNAPNSTLAATNGLFFEILHNVYFQLTYEASGNGRFSFLFNQGVGGSWYDWKLPGATGLQVTYDHSITAVALQFGDAAVHNLFVLATVAGGNGQQTYNVKVQLSAQAQNTAAGVTSGDSDVSELYATFKNVAGVLTQVGSTVVIANTHDASMAAVAFTFAISGVNIELQVQGINTVNINYQAHPISVTIE